MHYIQNTLFCSYGSWFLNVIILMICVVFYIQNNKQALKKSLVTLGVFLIISIISNLYFSKSLSIMTENITSKRFQIEQNEIKSTPDYLNLFNFLKNSISSKISE